MKKLFYLLIGVLIIIMAGCKKDDQMANFFPDPIIQDPKETKEELAEEETLQEETEEASEESKSVVNKPIKTGRTTTKYVKLGSYDAILNVRSEPSLQGEIVGFMVHAEKVEVLTIEDGWASFVMNDEIRYISADFLVDQRPPYYTPPTPKPKPTDAPESQEEEQDPNQEPPRI